MKDYKRIYRVARCKNICTYKGVIAICIGMALLFAPLNLFANVGAGFAMQQKSMPTWPSTTHKTASLLTYGHKVLQRCAVLHVGLCNVLVVPLTIHSKSGIQKDKNGVVQDVDEGAEDGYHEKKELSLFWMVVIILGVILFVIIMVVRRKNAELQHDKKKGRNIKS